MRANIINKMAKEIIFDNEEQYNNYVAYSEALKNRPIKDGIDGKNGQDGQDYILTEQDKQDIAASIEVPIVEKIIEKTVEKTEVIREQPIITQNIIEKAVSDTAEKERDKLISLPEGEKLPIEAIENLRKELNEAKKSGIGHNVVSSLKNLYQLLDVDVSGITANQSIKWDGTKWVAYTPSSGAVTSVSNSDGTLTISPTTGNVVASLNRAHDNAWTGKQTFSTSAPTAPGVYSTAEQWGEGARALGQESVALGYLTTAAGDKGTSIGAHSQSGNDGSVSIGWTATASGNSGPIAIGRSTFANANSAIALGFQAQATGTNAISVGQNMTTSGVGTVGIGVNLSSTGDGGVIIGSIMPSTSLSNVGLTLINPGVISTLDDYAILIGGALRGANRSIVIGKDASGTYNGSITIGSNSTADNQCIAIGLSATASYTNSMALGTGVITTATDQAIIGYTDTWFKQITGVGVPINLHSPDAVNGSDQNDVRGGDFNIKVGEGTGIAPGGSLKIFTSPADVSSTNTLNPSFQSVTVEGDGTTTFLKAPLITQDPVTDATGTLTYPDGSFFTGYTDPGAGYLDYKIYAGQTIGITKLWSLVGSVANSPFTFTGQTIFFVDNPTGGSATENPIGTGYASGDSINYYIYAYTSANGNYFYSPSPATASVTIAGAIASVDLAWTAATFPAGSTPVDFYRIWRDLNGSGYVDYLDVVSTTSFNDDNTPFTWNPLTLDPTPTTVASFAQIPFSWSAVSGANDYKMLRYINGVTGGATDMGNVTSFTDTGSLPWSDPLTVTPNIASANSVIINGVTGQVQVNNAYTLPAADGTSGQQLTTDGSGNLYWS